MHYIVLDLEWNQCPFGKAREDRRLPFEIIEIGAVKLNEKKEIVDTFHELIKPVVYRQIHFRTREIISLSIKDLDKGRLFPEAAADFLAWCGEDARFCTWGTLDLTELQRNLTYYNMDGAIKTPLFYEDVQKLFAIAYEERSTRRALQYAVEFLKIAEDGDFHEALMDAVYTARVLKFIPDEVISRNYSVDYYKTPTGRDDELKIRYGTYEKYITRGFPTKEAVMEDKEVRALRCFACGRSARQRIRWFSDYGKNYLSVGWCEEHGFVKGKVRLRRNEQGQVFAVKTTRLMTPEEADAVIARHRTLQERRTRKRHAGS